MMINTTYVQTFFFVDGVSLLFPQGTTEFKAVEMAATADEATDIDGEPYITHSYNIIQTHFTRHGTMVDLEYAD